MTSTRLSVTRVALYVKAGGFVLTLGMWWLRPETASSLAVLFAALAGASTYTTGRYQDGETQRPSGYYPEGMTQGSPSEPPGGE